jgi:hypothetical protein
MADSSLSKSRQPLNSSHRSNSKVLIPEQEKQSRPWKYLGCEEYSSFIASDDDFFVIRRFSTLTARVILALQDQLSQIEEQLESLERQLKIPEAGLVHNGSFQEEMHSSRTELVLKANLKLREYSLSPLPP